MRNQRSIEAQELPGMPPRRAGNREKRNLPADERRRTLLDAAVELFSERGMGVTAQALADRVNVTQPLIHRYFPAKADLIAAIRDRIQNAHWDPVWREIITDRGRAIDDRIVDFYRRYLPHIYSDAWYRGFWYAALADPGFAQTYLARVTEELLLAIVDEVRRENGFPDLSAIAADPREIELVWGMHSTTIFLGIRRYVYRTPVSPDVDTTVRDQMQAYLHMAPIVMSELMPPPASARPQPEQVTRGRPTEPSARRRQARRIQP
jgi:AcrR family transcriptional regulator